MANQMMHITYIKKAIAIHPKNTKHKDYLNTLTIKGKILTALEKYEKSIEIYNDIIELDKQYINFIRYRR